MIDRDLPLKKQISDNITRLRTARGWTQLKLSEKSGISKSTLSDYINCRTLISPGNVEKLSEAFGVPKSEIDPSFKQTDGNPSNLIPVAPMTVPVPILGTIACGDPLLAEQNLKGYRYESPDTLPSGNIFYLEAKGDSMEPTIPDGSHVLIREQPEVEYGQIAAVLVNGDTEATLKRIRKQGDYIMLMPDNPIHSPIIVDENNPVRIIGKAVRVTRDLS
ncbi:XRE family transcriptional regulator [Schinkia azotoformans]|uniref:Peptidase s24-like protein n=1 Tax=Schinkia azotoformans LMG 9581 TaxID=1131731 RepID=K6C9M3_SCHAZ|nr:XRE family transcriptional regulator [Schinkia azotoformans]EKN67835.1 peptidase s24-like protein [Schinkia azotoformans LMG 9581]MEC1637400.1 XRE family transcriptional regulator [Schinkia azotoformans]MEC1943804.1 XRE family transcriptional regulator [Schinkia azotoformans]